MPTARGNTKLSGFYFPWPLLNVQFARQIYQSRENTYKIAPLVRAAYVDPQPVTANDPGNHDLSGWAVGKRDFRNKFRIYYDQQFNRFSIQHNVGTEAEETWDDMILIRESDGRVTIVQDGGLEAQGGFYNQVPRNLATSGRFDPPSNEWIFTHNLNTKPILWDTFNLEDKSIVPVSVDVSDPNTAYFYFSQPYSGFAVVTGEQSRFSGIHVDDGNGNIFPTATRLGFNGAQFYASTDGHGMPVINLEPLDFSDSDTSTLPVNLIVEDSDAVSVFDMATLTLPAKLIFNRTDFYLRPDVTGNPIINIRGGAGGGSSGQFGTGIQAQDFSSSSEWVFNHGLGVDHIIWSVFDDNGLAVIPEKVSTHNNNVAYFYFTPAMAGRAVVAGGPLVNTITVTETDGAPSITASTVIFNSSDFYVESDSTGKPIVNFRGSSGGGGGGINAVIEDLTPTLGGNLNTNDFNIYTPVVTGSDNALSITLQAGDADSGRAGNINITAGSSVSGSDGSVNIAAFDTVALSGPTIALVGDINAESNFIHNVLDPVSPQDAATKAYVDANIGGGSGGAGLFYVRDDHNPSLGGDLDVTGFKITTKGDPSADITIQTGDSTAGLQAGAIILQGGSSSVGDGGSIFLFTGPGNPNGGVIGISSDGQLSLASNSDDVSISAGSGVITVNSAQITNLLDPTNPQDAATKAYVDANSGSGSGGGNFYAKMSDGTDFADTLIFATSDFVKTSHVLTINESGIDHSALANLAVGDPHPQYLLKTDQSPGFYGVVWSDGTVTKKTDRLSFNGSEFYLDGRKPTLNIKESGIDHNLLANLTVGDPHTQYIRVDGTRAFTADQSHGGFKITSLGTPTAATDGATKGYVDSAVGPGFYGIIVRESDGNPTPYRTDTLTFDSQYFYLNSDSKGHVMVSERANGITVTDGVSTYVSQSSIGFNTVDFYISRGAGNKPVINLRHQDDIIPVFIETAGIQGVAVDPIAPYGYNIDSVQFDCVSGSATCGFYLMPAAARTARPGQRIPGLDPIAINATLKKATPTSNFTVNVNDKLMLYIYANSAAKHVSFLVKARVL